MNHLSYQDRVKFCHAPIAKRLFNLLHNKQTNLALSADVTTCEELIAITEAVAAEIIVLKTHIDIIADFTPTVAKKLRALADQHEFLLFEDRKFADIGNTVKQQYAGGIYKIVEWADIINAHSLPGPGIVKGLMDASQHRERGLLLLAEMSSKEHLLDEVYQQKTLALAEQFNHFVIGFITQHALSPNPAWIYMTPGINLDSGDDALAQQYVTPDAAIQKGSDIIIVGRGITEAFNPKQEATRYRQAGWQAYLKRLESHSLKVTT